MPELQKADALLQELGEWMQQNQDALQKAVPYVIIAGNIFNLKSNLPLRGQKLDRLQQAQMENTMLEYLGHANRKLEQLSPPQNNLLEYLACPP